MSVQEVFRDVADGDLARDCYFGDILEALWRGGTVGVVEDESDGCLRDARLSSTGSADSLTHSGGNPAHRL